MAFRPTAQRIEALGRGLHGPAIHGKDIRRGRFAKERNSWRSKNVLSEFHASLKSQYTRNIVKDCDVSWLSIGMSVNLRYYVV